MLSKNHYLDLVASLVDEIYNHGYLDAIPRYYSEELAEYDPRVGDDITRSWRKFLDTFSGMKVSVELALADHDQVMAFLSWKGYQGSRELKLYTSELFQLKNEKVIMHGAVVDYCELGEFGFTPQRTKVPSSQILIGQHSSIEQQNAQVVLAAYDEVMSRHMLDRAKLYYKEDYLHHNLQMPSVPNGIDAFTEYFAGNFQRYPDLSVTVDHILAHGDFIMVFATWRGTFTGHTHGRKPSGRKLHMRTSDLFRLQNLQVAEHWEIVDYSGLQRAGIPIRSPHHTV